jgi:exosortase
MTATGDIPLQPDAKPSSTAWLRVAVLTALLAAVFGPMWAWAVGIWRGSEYYGHGFLLVPVSAYLTWRLWRTRPAPAGATWPGLLLILVGLLFHFISRLFDVWFPSGFGFVLVLAGLVWWLGGTSLLRHFWFPIVYLAFAVPVERFLILQFAQPMQLAATSFATKFTAAVGLPVKQIGTTVHMPDYTFEVAIPCSGLKSGIAMSALAAVLAYILEGALWARWLVFLAGVPVALAANAFRIILTLVLAQSIGKGAAEGFSHTVAGMFVFALALGGLLMVARSVGCKGMRSDI